MKTRLILFLLTLVLVTSAAAVVSAQEPAECEFGEDGKCRVVLVNSYLGNDYRIQMQRSAEVAAQYEPYADVIDFEILNTEFTPEAQRAGLENLLLEGVDAIILNAVDNTSVNDIVERACDEGVIVVTFDITARPGACEFAVEFDFYNWARDAGRWLAQETGAAEEPINIILDRGLQGVDIADRIAQGGLDGMADIAGNENINVVGEYYGEFAEGPQEPRIAGILAANPDTEIDAVFTQGYCTTVVSAFRNAGLDYLPAMYCQGYNANAVLCLEDGMRCFINASSFAGSIGSLDTVYRLVEGEQVECVAEDGTTSARGLGDEWVECVIPWGVEYYVTEIHDIGENTEKQVLLEEGVTAFPDLPPGFGLFYNWPGALVQISVSEAAGVDEAEMGAEATEEAGS